MASGNTIIIKQCNQRVELTAAGTVKPGHLVMRDSNGKAVVHNKARGCAQKIFALENELYGQAITDSYASGDQVPCFIPRRGDVIMCRLKASENVAIGAWLESAGDGAVQKLTQTSTSDLEYPNSIIGYALEASNVGSEALIAVEIA
jgi:hypothetical protein